MQNFSIGLSGLSAAQKALDIIGNNMANAATEGYHRQRVELAPAYMAQVGLVLLGGGVDVTGVTRLIDNILEQEILRQQSSLEQVRCEFNSLRTVENTFAELSGGSLGTVIDEFFNALQDLSVHPGEIVWQNQVVSAAENLAWRFRMLDEFLAGLENGIALEAASTVQEINTLTSQIAGLNDNIRRMEIGGGQTNNLRDERDQLISKLSELVGVETLAREFGVVDVTVAGIPVVTGVDAIALEVGLREDGNLGVSIPGVYSYITDVEGGRLGGQLSLRNDILVNIHQDLNDLAGAIIQQINRYHVQGAGSEGSFTQLTGHLMLSENLAEFDPPLSSGRIYIRVTDASTGAVTRNAIDVDPSSDTLTTIAAAISAITGVSATVNASNKLAISADANYEFDFLPAVLSGPTAGTLTGAAPPTISVSGIYTGAVNDTLRFTVSGSGSVGNGNLQLEVRDGGGAGNVIAILNVGQGYAAGDFLDIDNGIRVSLGAGDFGAGDSFDVDVLADSDTSGLLAAVGMNTFFSGATARDIAVRSDIVESPGRVATALGVDMADNTNALRLAGLRDQSLSILDGLTPGEFYRRLVTDIGQQLSTRQMHEENLEVIMRNLADQRSDISGVNINDEAAQMLVFEQMFQAMAKYLNTVHTSLLTVMEIL